MPETNEKGLPYKDLYEAQLKINGEQKKDLDDALKKYNDLVGDYNALKQSIRASVIKTLGGLVGDMTAMGFNSPNFDKLEQEKPAETTPDQK